MKHLFVIHSNITYLAALGVIVKEKLKEEDVAIISWNNFQRETPIKVTVINQYAGIRAAIKHPLNCLFSVKYLDRTIAKLVGNELFIAYTEALYFFHDVVITHPLCMKFNFIEEGLSAYYRTIDYHDHTMNYSQQPCYRYYGWKGFRKKMQDILWLIKGYKLEMLGLPGLPQAFFNTADVDFYGFCDKAFNGTNNLKIIQLRDVANSFEWSLYYDCLEDIDIWLGQNNPQGGNDLIDVYVKAIEKGCARNILSRGKKKIMVKFHPFEEEYSKEQTILMFKRNDIDVEIIPNEVILELEFFNAHNVRVYSVSSSLLLYASLLGIECNSVIKHMPKEAMMDIPALFSNCNMV